PDDYENVGVNHLVCLHNDEINRFVFFPAGSNFNNYSVFYILNNNSLEDACRLLLNDMVVCASLTAPDGSVPISTQSKKSARTLSSPLSKNDTDLYFSESFFGGYRLSAQYRSDVLSGRISAAIRDGLAWYLLIAFSGFALVILCTFSTYHPLYRLAHKFSKSDSDDYNLLRHLDRAIESQQMQNDNLRTRIEHYRTLMQKMLLDSVLVSGSPEAEPGLDIDAYFLLPEQHFIAVFALNAVFAPEKIFEEDDHALLLKQEENTAFYLVNRYFDKNLSHESTLVGIADGIFRKTGAFVGISDSTSSAIDIPSLVEQALGALSCAGEGSPTVLYQNLDAAFSENPTDYQYPHDLINRFSQSLSACDFILAREALSELTGLLSDVRAPGDALPDFFIRSVLIDMLSELAIQMDNMSVRFREYEDLYFKALYLCRSCSFLENETEISSCFTEMLDIFEACTVSNFPNAEKIRKIVEENISNPDFSISVLYAGQDISLAYMTRLFKKETGENFSDYLWKVRYKKAVELLEEGKMSINEISLAVGYLHPSSFRRKFKQENGESPTNYRTGHT
ncbi:MAG: helix-turn-helix transcriptional regulator, partial [Clostridia bacterium]|nr:helix-turn-helix transcriptional regulator [Clostridia bacterium]